MTHAEPELRSQRRGNVWVIAGAVVLMTALVLPLLLSWFSGGDGDIQQVLITAVPDEGTGAYVLTDGGAYQLYGLSVIMSRAPDDAVTLAPDEFRGVTVVMKVLGTPESYRLYSLATGEDVVWVDSVQQGQRLTLQPGTLPGGDYLLEVPTGGGVFHESTYYYFRLR